MLVIQPCYLSTYANILKTSKCFRFQHECWGECDWHLLATSLPTNSRCQILCGDHVDDAMRRWVFIPVYSASSTVGKKAKKWRWCWNLRLAVMRSIFKCVKPRRRKQKSCLLNHTFQTNDPSWNRLPSWRWPHCCRNPWVPSVNRHMRCGFKDTFLPIEG